MKGHLIEAADSIALIVDRDIPAWISQAVEDLKKRANGRTAVLIVRPKEKQPGIVITSTDAWEAMGTTIAAENDPQFVESWQQSVDELLRGKDGKARA